MSWIGTQPQVSPLPPLHNCLCSSFLAVLVVLFRSFILFLLGASISACCEGERHIVALEADTKIFEVILRPMRDPVPLPKPTVHLEDSHSEDPA